MNIKWEKNSRVNRLVAEDKIREEDVIARCKTDEFPPEMATVRIQRVREKNPDIVIHIRGKSKQARWNGNAYEQAITCRVTIGSRWNTGDCMSSSGELDEEYDWQDVHNVVTRVKGAIKV